MNDLDRYLTQVYRRDMLHESGVVEMPEPTPELIRAIKAQMAEIDALARSLGANLVNRDFISYQNRRALAGLLAQLEARDAT